MLPSSSKTPTNNEEAEKTASGGGGKMLISLFHRSTRLRIDENYASTEWMCSDPRIAVGVDLELEALTWCMENNVNKIGVDC
ncbi:hypothetical protein HHK36_020566 [Tetracentron sinense]|uniref:Uncharacterized protein n=1 Tax=Tetracentron sinense TaxID=13715 RepID=A0A834YXZ1_TETSI|nr:hypothetical protein HHK36_020566 [Tetracentron sinense]